MLIALNDEVKSRECHTNMDPFLIYGNNENTNILAINWFILYFIHEYFI